MTIQYRTDVNGNAQQEFTEEDMPDEAYLEDDKALEIYRPQDLVPLRAQENEVPMYLQVLSGLQVDSEEKLAQLSLFESGHPCKFDRYLNKEVEVLGAIVYWKPPYIAQKEVKKGTEVIARPGEEAPGYDQIRLLINDFDENDLPYVVCCSMGSLGNHLYAILSLNGWYLWDKPVKYRFWRDENTSGFRLTNLDRARSLKASFSHKDNKK